MESPSSWTLMHHQLRDAYYPLQKPESVVEVFYLYKYQINVAQVQEIIEQHQKGVEARRCGASLIHTLVTKLAVPENLKV